MEKHGAQGTVLAGRYRLTEPYPDQLDIPGTQQWFGVDQVLSTAVRILLLDPALPTLPAALDAARRSALIEDAHVIRTLSVGEDFVVSEVPLGVSLAHFSADEGLDPALAKSVVGELAAILSQTSTKGMRHLRLRPSRVRVGDSGEVYIDGLGVDAELAGLGTDSLSLADADNAEAYGLARFLAALIEGEEVDQHGIDALAEDESLPADVREVLRRAGSPVGILSPGEVLRLLAPWDEIDPESLPDRTSGPAPFPADYEPGGAVAGGAVAGGPSASASGGKLASGLADSAAGQAGVTEGEAGQAEASDADAEASGPGSAAEAHDPTGEAGASAAEASTAVGTTDAAIDAELRITEPAAVNLRPQWGAPAELSEVAAAEAAEEAAAAGLSSSAGAGGGTGGTTTGKASGKADRKANSAASDKAGRNTSSKKGHAPAGSSAASAAAATKSGTKAATDPATSPERRERPRVIDRDGAGKTTWAAQIFNTSKLVVGGAVVLVVLALWFAIHQLTSPTTPVKTVAPTISAAPAEPSRAARPGGEATQEPSAQATPTAAPTIASYTLVNPDPSNRPGQDSPEALPNAFDGNPETVWSTYEYLRNPNFGLLKDGMGIEIKLESEAVVHNVHLNVHGQGGNVQWRTTTAADPAGGTLVAEGPMSPQTVLTSADGVKTDTIMLWFTQLPTNDAGKFKIDLAEVTID